MYRETVDKNSQKWYNVCIKNTEKNSMTEHEELRMLRALAAKQAQELEASKRIIAERDEKIRKQNIQIDNIIQEINDKMRDLAKQLEDKYPYFQVVVEKNDSRNYLYQFYKEGKLIKGIHIFLNQVFGNMTIRISTNFYSFSNNSWNEEYISQDIDGKLYLVSQFSYVSKEYKMSSEDVVKDIWKKYINPYLS